MGSYKIEILSSADKEARKIQKDLLRRIIDGIDSLSENPFPEQTKKLAGSKSSYRIRVGQYRILYEVNRAEKIVTIYHIRHRKDVYRKL